jgi:two-component SAPR family response regulator
MVGQPNSRHSVSPATGRWSIGAQVMPAGSAAERFGATYIACVRVGILGAAEARLNGAAVDLGTRKQRALLAALAMHRGRPVVPDSIVDLLWGESPPTAVTATCRVRRPTAPCPATSHWGIS